MIDHGPAGAPSSMEIPREWTFRTSDVAQGFDRHVREQLPWYDLMAGAAAHVVRHYATEGGVVYDIGCATGNLGRLLEDTIRRRRIDFRPVDAAESMGPVYRGPGTIQIADACEMDFAPFDVAVLFLTLMFVAPHRRPELLRTLRSRVRPGGCVLIVDKVESKGGYVGTVLSRLTLAGKMAARVPADEVLAKELSLAGVQRPLRETEIGPAERIFQFGEFVGWVVEG